MHWFIDGTHVVWSVRSYSSWLWYIQCFRVLSALLHTHAIQCMQLVCVLCHRTDIRSQYWRDWSEVRWDMEHCCGVHWNSLTFWHELAISFSYPVLYVHSCKVRKHTYHGSSVTSDNIHYACVCLQWVLLYSGIHIVSMLSIMWWDPITAMYMLCLRSIAYQLNS